MIFRDAHGVSVSRSRASVVTRVRATDVMRSEFTREFHRGYAGIWKTQSAAASSCQPPDSSRSPITGVAPAERRPSAASEDRARANTGWPRPRRTLIRAVPTNPSAPVMNAVAAPATGMGPVWSAATEANTHSSRTALVRGSYDRRGTIERGSNPAVGGGPHYGRLLFH